MKKIILAFLPFLLIACAPKKDVAAFINGKHKIESECPKDGTCKFEVLKDKSLDIKTDDTGKSYYTLADAPGKIVMLYTYDKTTRGDIQDGSYKETIVFEMDSKFSNLNTGNIKDAKMLFGVHCFCRKAGFYKVNDGAMSYNDGRLLIKIPDNIIENQRIHTIDVVLKT